MTVRGAEQLARSVHQEVGVVRSTAPLRVETAAGTFEVRRAASCLVAPEDGDRVLVAVPAVGELFVLAVLARAGEGPLPIETDGDVRWSSTGMVTLHGDEGVAISGREVGVRGVAVEVEFDRLGVVGRTIEAHATVAKAALERLDTFLERASTHVKRSYRFVEELESTRAGKVDLRVRQSLVMRAANSFLSAERLVKLDGEQIHMG